MKKRLSFRQMGGSIHFTNDTITLNKNSDTSITAVFEEDDNYSDIIVINKIFFKNFTVEAPNDWVELNNKGSQEVDLFDWIIRDEDDTHAFIILQCTTIPSGDYLVICRDKLAYNSFYGRTDEGIGDMDFGLDNGSDCVIII